jgi:predicted TIM-barrel fold metal-dependent hydrolase
MNGPFRAFAFLLVLTGSVGAAAPGDPPAYRRVKAALDAVPAIDTHDHLWAFSMLAGHVETERGRGMNLFSIWQRSYFPQVATITPWKGGGRFDDWWATARNDFVNARATGFYRYQRVALQDLYGIDFDVITDAEARRLDDQIFANYANDRWLHHVITERANIELMFVDPHWSRMSATSHYAFTVPVFRVNDLFVAFHPSEIAVPADNPWHTPEARDLKMATLDDYVVLIDRLFARMKATGAICLKMTINNQPSLKFENVPRDVAARAFGRPRATLTPAEVKAFADFVMWRVCELSARYELPFQIHTGLSRLDGSNPILLVNVIEANPKTKFILFHGGYPWLSESAAIAQRHRNVWLDSVWLPSISPTAAHRALHEWLEVVASNRIMWGADGNVAEGIYGATEMTRRVLAGVLAEKIERGELREPDALRIGRQILRDNALALFPQLESRLWKHRPKSTLP